MAIRIEGSGGRKDAGRSSPIENAIERVPKTDTAAFGSYLGRSFGQAQEDRLFQKAKEIEAQGVKLADRVDIGELKAYKRLIADFLEEAVAGYGKFSKESFLDRRGRHRVYATVKSINEKLETLTAEVLKGEKSNLAIAGRISDIRGLVLDLFL